MLRRLISLSAGIVLLAAAAPGQGRTLPPAADFSPGWSLGDRTAFEGGGLFDFIDGGAEIFLEFGFKRVTVQRYVKGNDELTLEAYEMADADAALGIYLMKCGVEAPVAGVPARNTGDPAQLTILKGRYFLHVNSFGPGAELLPEMVRLAGRALEAIPDDQPGPHLDRLPVEGRVPGSARLIRGPYALQSIVTLGEGDILLLAGRSVAVAADYLADGGSWTLILVAYPDESAAKAAVAHLRANLDSYLEVVRERAGGFVFKDFKDRLGEVRLTGPILEIRLNLAYAPESLIFGARPDLR